MPKQAGHSDAVTNVLATGAANLGLSQPELPNVSDTASRGPKRERISRRLCQQHFAVYRGYLEGLPIDKLVERYLEPTDTSSARQALRDIRDELSMAAGRLGWLHSAKLLRRPPSNPTSASVSTRTLPTLDEFRARYDPDGVLSEADLLLSYRDVFAPQAQGTIRRTSRQSDMRRRQFVALDALAKACAESPQAQHPLRGWVEWIGPRLADQLAAASITSIGELAEYVNKNGYRWYMRVPRVGEKAAQRLVAWLERNRESIGCRLAITALRPQRTISPDELPVRRVLGGGAIQLKQLESAGSGDGGSNSEEAKFITLDSSNDYDAIRHWIDFPGTSPHTRRARRKEAERLLQWSYLERNKPLLSLTPDDAASYFAFLSDPQPVERWVGSRRVPRWHPDWRPFDGALSPASQATALATIISMFAWLKRQRCIAVNPFTDLCRPITSNKTEAGRRRLDYATWHYLINDGVAAVPEAARSRARFALLLAFSTGLRLAEITQARLADLDLRSGGDVLPDTWVLRVMRSRGRMEHFSLPSQLADALTLYFADRNLSMAHDSWPSTAPLIASLCRELPLTQGAMAALYRDIFQRAADKLDSRQSGAGSTLRHATVSWLRHAKFNF